VEAVIKLLVGDCRKRLRELEAGSVHTCVSSPPYFGLRDYGHDDQIGAEESPEAYVAQLVEVFSEVRRVLRDDGTLWLNLGDSYARNPATGGSGTPNGRNVSRQGYGGGGGIPLGVKEKDLLGIPWMTAFALRADGWFLRQEIIWHKVNPMPESVKDRPTRSHEQIFLLSKSPAYYFDAAAIAEPAVGTSIHDLTGGGYAPPGQRPSTPRKRGPALHPDTKSTNGNGGLSRREPMPTRNRRSVWTVIAEPFGGAHFATYPPALVEPCILAGSPEGGTVIDPFGGAGTTALVADRLKRNAVICELNPEYAEIAHKRLVSDAGMFLKLEVL
jgi:DNA modification methylase